MVALVDRVFSNFGLADHVCSGQIWGCRANLGWLAGPNNGAGAGGGTRGCSSVGYPSSTNQVQLPPTAAAMLAGVAPKARGFSSTMAVAPAGNSVMAAVVLEASPKTGRQARL
ncbi:hypothetical protein E2562_014639 [Oryza meyeriana var. granulata]|uniref:Uncharacterized protein n=1 Tax=Oryza meyeriana var. granulata TaxID=110450 RepID=A0A6G1D2U6_9ORYZ|nr:hypothetical protein E2562_014639 [Oryza meyeriana var. granulata]